MVRKICEHCELRWTTMDGRTYARASEHNKLTYEPFAQDSYNGSDCVGRLRIYWSFLIKEGYCEQSLIDSTSTLSLYRYQREAICTFCEGYCEQSDSPNYGDALCKIKITFNYSLTDFTNQNYILTIH